jgi:hypothetical protein
LSVRSPGPTESNRRCDGAPTNRPQLFEDLTIPFYGFNRPGAKTNDGPLESFWLMGMPDDIKGLAQVDPDTFKADLLAFALSAEQAKRTAETQWYTPRS